MKNELELRVGDYISEPNDEEIYSNEDFVLSQIVRKGDKYTRLFVEKLLRKQQHVLEHAAVFLCRRV